MRQNGNLFSAFSAVPLLQFVVRLTKCMAKQPAKQQLATATAAAAVQCMRLKLKLKFCTLHLKQQTENATATATRSQLQQCENANCDHKNCGPTATAAKTGRERGLGHARCCGFGWRNAASRCTVGKKSKELDVRFVQRLSLIHIQNKTANGKSMITSFDIKPKLQKKYQDFLTNFNSSTPNPVNQFSLSA